MSVYQKRLQNSTEGRDNILKLPFLRSESLKLCAKTFRLSAQLTVPVSSVSGNSIKGLSHDFFIQILRARIGRLLDENSYD